MNDELVLCCVHILSGQPVYYETKSHDIICKECFRRINSCGHDKNGYRIIPAELKNDLKTVCKKCVAH